MVFLFFFSTLDGVTSDGTDWFGFTLIKRYSGGGWISKVRTAGMVALQRSPGKGFWKGCVPMVPSARYRRALAAVFVVMGCGRKSLT